MNKENLKARPDHIAIDAQITAFQTKRLIGHMLSSFQGCSQKSDDGGAKILDRKPHPLINAERKYRCANHCFPN